MRWGGPRALPGCVQVKKSRRLWVPHTWVSSPILPISQNWTLGYQSSAPPRPGHAAAGCRPLAPEGERRWRRRWRRRWPARGSAGSLGCWASPAAGPCTSAGVSAAGARTGSCTSGSCRDCGASGPCSPSTWRPPSWASAVRPRWLWARAPSPPRKLSSAQEWGPGLRRHVCASSCGVSPASVLSYYLGLWFLLGELSSALPGRLQGGQHRRGWGYLGSHVTRWQLLPSLRQSLSFCFLVCHQSIDRTAPVLSTTTCCSLTPSDQDVTTVLCSWLLGLPLPHALPPPSPPLLLRYN